jgi:hypothetical protein
MFAGSPKDARKKTVVYPDISKTTFIYCLSLIFDFPNVGCLFVFIKPSNFFLKRVVLRIY